MVSLLVFQANNKGFDHEKPGKPHEDCKDNIIVVLDVYVTKKSQDTLEKLNAEKCEINGDKVNHCS